MLTHHWKFIYPFQNRIEIQFGNNYFSYLFLQISNMKPQLSTLKINSPCRRDMGGVPTTVSQWTEVHRDISAASVWQVQHAAELQCLSSFEVDYRQALPLFHTAAFWCGHCRRRQSQHYGYWFQGYLQAQAVPEEATWQGHSRDSMCEQEWWPLQNERNAFLHIRKTHSHRLWIRERCSSWIISLRNCHLLWWSG